MAHNIDMSNRRTPRIDVVHGSKFATADDRALALTAAIDALNAGVSREDAECAANLALTKGWHDPDGAHCELIVDDE